MEIKKYTILGMMIKYLNENDFVIRQELIYYIKHNHDCNITGTIDNFRNYFTQAGYLEKIGRGKYKVIKKPSYDLTTTQLRKEAYPNYIPWKVLSEMEDLFTDFSIDYTQDVILLNDSHLSVIMNPKTKHKRFLGYSIRSVAESYARNKNKKIKFAQ